MSSSLDLKKLKSIAKIKYILNGKVEFKIGKTDDWERRKCQYEAEGYPHFYIIAECKTLEEVNKLEIDLISFFKKSHPICMNENEGGGGRTSESEKYYIYLVAR